ncbi:MAG: hypothetical protein AABO41_08340 [Acidobacteriota bacterium]
MKPTARLVFLAVLVAAPLSQAHSLGLYSTLFFAGTGVPEALAEAERVNRVDRANFDRSARFVISTIDRPMIEEFGQAWQRAGAGTVTTESVVLILRMARGGYSARSMGISNEYKSFTFPWHPATVAIVHTHPNDSSPRPQKQDIKVADKYRVPIFTLTNRGMFVYDPATRTTSKVKDGLDWLDPSKWRPNSPEKR